jgi:hypothetical protein
MTPASKNLLIKICGRCREGKIDRAPVDLSDEMVELLTFGHITLEEHRSVAPTKKGWLVGGKYDREMLVKNKTHP